MRDSNMQESINKRRLILLIVLTAATIVAYWWVQPGNRLGIRPDIFLVDDLQTISAVTLDSDTATVRLAYNGSYWRVNDRYDADPDMISVLFATLQQARPKRAVSQARRDSIFAALKQTGVKVSLFDNAALKQSFYAGGNATKTQAWFADPASGNVYAMNIPGYRVYVSGIFELPADGWRNKLVFGFNWRNFKALEVEFHNPASPGFRVSMGEDYFTIEGLQSVDTARLNTFLDDVSLLTVDQYRSVPQLRDSLKQVVPDMEIRVIDVARRTYQLRLYGGEADDRFFGLIGEAQPAIFDARKIRPLLRPKSFYIKK